MLAKQCANTVSRMKAVAIAALTSISVVQCCPPDGVLATLSTVGLAANAVHSNGNGLVSLKTQQQHT
jgi:hypothetical protein